MTDMTLGSAVFIVRTSRGMTSEQLAEAVGISPAQIERIEQGRSSPRPARDERVMAALGFLDRRDLMLAARTARQAEEKTA